jgi:hypothetical protein
MAPRGGLTAPRGGLTAPRGGLTAPRGGLTAPRGGLTAPRDELTAPRGGLTAPRDELTASAGELAAPKRLGATQSTLPNVSALVWSDYKNEPRRGDISTSGDAATPRLTLCRIVPRQRRWEGRQNGVTHSERSYRGLQREL